MISDRVRRSGKIRCAHSRPFPPLFFFYSCHFIFSWNRDGCFLPHKHFGSLSKSIHTSASIPPQRGWLGVGGLSFHLFFFFGFFFFFWGSRGRFLFCPLEEKVDRIHRPEQFFLPPDELVSFSSPIFFFFHLSPLMLLYSFRSRL